MQRNVSGAQAQTTARTGGSLARFSLSQQFALTAGAVCLLVALVLVLVSSFSSRFILQEEQDHRGQALSEHLATAIAPLVARGDLIGLEVTLRQLRGLHAARQLVVVDIEGRPLASAGSNGDKLGLTYRAAITIEGDIAGELALILSPGAALLEQRRMTWALVSLAVLLSLFVAAICARWGQHMGQRLRRLTEKLTLDRESEQTAGSGEEIALLETAVQQLPLNLLRAPDTVTAGPADYGEASLLYLRLDSLGSYVETLDEESLLHYTETQRRIVIGAAQLYGGNLSVARQFGLLLSFGGEHPSGTPAFRAASAAWLIRQTGEAVAAQGSLRHTVSQACGASDSGIGSAEDIYPDLYNQHIVDQLADMLPREQGVVLLESRLAGDQQVRNRCLLETHGEETRLVGFEEPYLNLLERQREIVLRETRRGA